jgi:hypothetical protein
MKDKKFERLMRKRRQQLDLEGTELAVMDYRRHRDMWLVSMELARHRNRGDYIR